MNDYYLKITTVKNKLAVKIQDCVPIPCNDFTEVVSQVLDVYSLLPPWTKSYSGLCQYQLHFEQRASGQLTREQKTVLERVVNIGNKLVGITKVLEEC